MTITIKYVNDRSLVSNNKMCKLEGSLWDMKHMCAVSQGSDCDKTTIYFIKSSDSNSVTILIYLLGHYLFLA